MSSLSFIRTSGIVFLPPYHSNLQSTHQTSSNPLSSGLQRQRGRCQARPRVVCTTRDCSSGHEKFAVRACSTTIQEAEGTTEQEQQQDVIVKEKLLQEEEDPRSKGLHKKEDDARSAAAFTMSKVPSRYKKRYKKEEGQEIWSPREVVLQILALNHWDDIDGILNHWMGRFNRKNFPPLIAEMTRTGALEHSIRVFNWMKAQRCYRARNDIYNNMIWLHARHQRAEQARGLFFEMQEWRSAGILFSFLFVER
jgi:hypothetical protein